MCCLKTKVFEGRWMRQIAFMSIIRASNIRNAEHGEEKIQNMLKFEANFFLWPRPMEKQVLYVN